MQIVVAAVLFTSTEEAGRVDPRFFYDARTGDPESA
jgi:hypothetical protein